MVGRTKVLLNCVGPYAKYGRQVVDACISARTHHFDVSAELQYIEGTQLECHSEAETNETIIVSTCGWCSIIPELSIAYMREHFGGILHSVETFLDFKPGKHVSRSFSEYVDSFFVCLFYP